MSWLWVYKAGPVGSLETLTDYCRSVRVINDHSAGKRGMNPVAEYRHGEVSTPRKYVRPLTVLLETVIRYTNAAGAVTHTDGAAGHYMENIGHLDRLFGGTQAALTRLERTAPNEGTVYLDVELLGDPTEIVPLVTYHWPIRSPLPFWQGAADTANATPTFTVAGTAQAGSLVIKFTGTATAPRLTLDATGDYIEIAGALPAGGVTVDVGNGTCTKITGGADYSNNLVVSAPYWMELDPGANAVTVSQGSGTPTVTGDWVAQWR